MQAKPPNEKVQQQAAELCGASVRALTGLRELRHRGRSLFLAGQRVNTGAPHSALDPLQDDFCAQRGAADGIALRLLHSDTKLHHRLAPRAPVQRLIFDMLEQLRVETLVSAEHPGMRSNLLQRFRAAAPGIAVNLSYMPTNTQRQALFDGSLDPCDFFCHPCADDFLTVNQGPD